MEWPFRIRRRLKEIEALLRVQQTQIETLQTALHEHALSEFLHLKPGESELIAEVVAWLREERGDHGAV